MIFRGFRYKLAPTPEQDGLLRQTAGVCRLIYNLAFEQRRDWWRQFRRETGRGINYASQCRELTALRAEFDWIASVSQAAQEQSLRDLDRAFVNFFEGRAKYPTPRRKGVDDAFRFKSRDCAVRKISAKWSAAHVPKIGWVKFRDTRPMIGELRNATIGHSADGWHISFSCMVEHEAPINICPPVGVDRGVANTLTFSTGERLSIPASLVAIERSKRRQQQSLARKKRGSAGHRKQLRRVARLAARMVRVRRDWHHKAALSLSLRFGTAVLEDLNIIGMTASARGTIAAPGSLVSQKSGLSRAILNQGWGAFETILTYKMGERGGRVVKVDPAHTSQTCASCGTIDARSRESQAAFGCVACGHRDHADVNAAKNILRRWSAPCQPVERSHQRLCEAGTGRAVIGLENPVPIGIGRR